MMAFAKSWRRKWKSAARSGPHCRRQGDDASRSKALP